MLDSSGRTTDTPFQKAELELEAQKITIGAQEGESKRQQFRAQVVNVIMSQGLFVFRRKIHEGTRCPHIARARRLSSKRSSCIQRWLVETQWQVICSCWGWWWRVSYFHEKTNQVSMTGDLIALLRPYTPMQLVLCFYYISPFDSHSGWSSRS